MEELKQSVSSILVQLIKLNYRIKSMKDNFTDSFSGRFDLEEDLNVFNEDFIKAVGRLSDIHDNLESSNENVKESKKYKLSPELCEFLNVESDVTMTKNDVYDLIIRYIKNNKINRGMKIDLESSDAGKKLKRIVNTSLENEEFDSNNKPTGRTYNMYEKHGISIYT